MNPRQIDNFVVGSLVCLVAGGLLVPAAGGSLAAQDKTAGPRTVEITTLAGESHSGVLQQLDAAKVSLASDEQPIGLPLEEVLSVRFTAAETAGVGPAEGMRIALVDGSRITCRQFTASGTTATVESETLGTLKIPLAAVLSVRFDLSQVRFDDAWQGLAKNDLRNDLLVLTKERVLDRIGGVVGGIDENNVTFLLDGEEIPVKRERIYGVVYARDAYSGGESRCVASLANTDRLKLRQIAFGGESFQGMLESGAEVAFPAEAVEELDFSAGKVRYLSRMEPRDVEYTPFIDDEAERDLMQYSRDGNRQGRPLRLAKTTYPRGLWIHSKTRLRYRIGGEYHRFQAVMGIDYPVASQGLGDVHVVISGDGEVLLESDVKGTDPPRPLDLDVSGVRDLEILVDFGGDFAFADHLVLAEARVTK